MKTVILLAALCAAALLSQTKQDLGNRALRGPLVWVLDSSGVPVAANLDNATLALDPPGTSGGRPTLRAVIPSIAPAVIKQRVLTVTYTGVPIVLPSAPAANMPVTVFWGPLYQRPTEYSVSGRTVTMAAGFVAGDELTFIWFE